MPNPTNDRSEQYLRFSRRSLTVFLMLVLASGLVCIAMAVRPFAPVWSRSVPTLWIVAVAITVGLQRSLGGNRWDPRVPEVRAIMDDEWRRRNMDRARRVAFAVVLGVQLPLGLLLARLPSLQAVLAMATATITVGVATLIALFLYFDRDAYDA